MNASRFLPRAVAILRIFWGVVFLTNGLAKLVPGISGTPFGFLIDSAGAKGILAHDVKHHPVQLYHDLVYNLLLPNWSLFGPLVGITETAAGLMLVFGVARAAAQVSGYDATRRNSSSMGAENLKVRQLSAVAFRIAVSAPGWVAVSVPYAEGWSLNGIAALPTIEGSIIVHVGRGGGVLVYTPWRSARWGYAISGSAFVLFLALIFWKERTTLEPRPDARQETV